MDATHFFVSDLHPRVKEEDLETKFPNALRVQLARDRLTGKSFRLGDAIKVSKDTHPEDPSGKSYVGMYLPHMEQSTVVDNVTNTSKDSRLRTSSGKFMDRGQDETIRAIRLHFLTCSSEGLTGIFLGLRKGSSRIYGYWRGILELIIVYLIFLQGICDKRRPQANLEDHMPSRVYETKGAFGYV
nr:probable prolyl 4-hydroxylase 10 [Tanacetum cinerariifolium]